MTKTSSLFRGTDGRNYASLFILISILFFLWGLCNGMIDTLNKHFQNSLHITKTESGFVQFVNFIAYAIMAVPAGLIARRFGYKAGILVGLILIALGAFWFMPATHFGTYAAFLSGLFILAAGLACLETIANPYATILGAPELGAVRLNMAQTCNAIGWILGPIVAGHFVLSSTGEVNRSNEHLYLPYLGVGLLVMVLIVLFWIVKVPDLRASEESAPRVETPGRELGRPLIERAHFLLGVAAQFFYVGAQVGIFDYFINYVTGPEMPALTATFVNWLPGGSTFVSQGQAHLTDQGAATLLAASSVIFLVGRATGSVFVRVLTGPVALAVFACANTLLMGLLLLPLGWISVAALFLSFYFMSIMFPTIFALGIHGLGERTKIGSSVIVMSIVGGAFMPFVMWGLADHFHSLRIGFLMPLICFAAVFAYAVAWPWLERRDAAAPVRA